MVADQPLNGYRHILMHELNETPAPRRLGHRGGIYIRYLLLGPESAELRLGLCQFFYFWLCRGVMRMRHSVPEIKMKDYISRTYW